MNNTAIVLLASSMGVGERASTAGIVALQGILTIFLVLSILWGAIEIMHLLLHRGKEDEKQNSPASHGGTASAPATSDSAISTANAGAPATSDAAIAAAIAASIAASEDEGATVAAITAAIISARAEEGNTAPFRVVAFKRVGRTSAHQKN